LKKTLAKPENPLPELINDDTFELLYSKGFFSDNAIRDYLIRKKFIQLRSKKISVADAIETIMDDYKYLEFDTIRKIVYKKFDKPRKAA
jgi:hypothetical protein